MAVLGLRCCTRALSSCGKRGPLFTVVRGPHCSGLSCCRARALGAWAAVAVACGLRSCGLRAPELRLSSCGTWAQLPRGTWDLPGPGLEPMSPALAGGPSTTAPPGKSPAAVFIEVFSSLFSAFPASSLSSSSSILNTF